MNIAILIFSVIGIIAYYKVFYALSLLMNSVKQTLLSSIKREIKWNMTYLIIKVLNWP